MYVIWSTLAAIINLSEEYMQDIYKQLLKANEAILRVYRLAPTQKGSSPLIISSQLGAW